MTDRSNHERLTEAFERALDMDHHERSELLDSLRSTDPLLAEELARLLPYADLPSEAWVPKSTEACDASGEQEIRLPGLRMGALIGSGGSSDVYRAIQDEPLNRTVAVKVLHERLAGAQARVRMVREATLLAALDHENIGRLLTYEVLPDGRPCLITEFIDGMPITVFAKSNALGLRERLRLFLQVCDALQFAHTRLVIHRDLKPANVLVDGTNTKPRVKVIDFGVGRSMERSAKRDFTQQHQLVGTPEYMSPEQASFGEEPVDTRADVFSLGLLLFELLTDNPARKRRSGEPLTRLLARVTQDQVPSPRGILPHARSARGSRAIPKDLDAICRRATALNPDDRYPTVAALALDVHRHLEGRPVSARPASLFYELARLVQRHRVAFASVAVVVPTMLALAAVAVVSLANARTSESMRARSNSTSLVNLAANALDRSDAASAVNLLQQVPFEHRDFAWCFVAGATDQSLDAVMLCEMGLSGMIQAGPASVLIGDRSGKLHRVQVRPGGLRLLDSTHVAGAIRVMTDIDAASFLLVTDDGVTRRTRSALSPVWSNTTLVDAWFAARLNSELAAVASTTHLHLLNLASGRTVDAWEAPNEITGLAATSRGVAVEIDGRRHVYLPLDQTNSLAAPVDVECEDCSLVPPLARVPSGMPSSPPEAHAAESRVALEMLAPRSPDVPLGAAAILRVDEQLVWATPGGALRVGISEQPDTLRTLLGHTGRITGAVTLRGAADRTVLIDEGGFARLWELPRVKPSAARVVAMSSDGSRRVSTIEDAYHIEQRDTDTDRWSLVAAVGQAPQAPAARVFEGEFAALRAEDGSVMIVDGRGALVERVRMDPAEINFEFMDRGTLLIADASGAVRVVALGENGGERIEVPGVRPTAVSKGPGRTILVGCNDGSVLQLTRRGARFVETQRTRLPKTITSFAVHPEAILVGDGEGYLSVLTPSDLGVVTRLRTSDVAISGITIDPSLANIHVTPLDGRPIVMRSRRSLVHRGGS